jgi:molybdate transport system ATP-binding protein
VDRKEAALDALSVDEVQVERGSFVLRASVRFAAPMTALLGASGCGKTTLLRAIAGFERPTAGRIALGDRILCDAAANVWVPPWERRIGVVFQEPRLWPHMTVDKTIRYGGDHRASEVIAWCELEPLLDRRPTHLSGGEAQRVAIARAVLAKPAALLLDEPFAGLDPERRARLRALLQTLSASMDIPMVCVTHNLSDALAMTDRLALMRAGEVVGEGPLNALLSAPETFRIADGLGLENQLLVTVAEHADGVTLASVGDTRLTIPSVDPSTASVGDVIRVAIRPEDLMVSLGPLAGVSAQNALSGPIAEVHNVGDRLLIHVVIDGQAVRAEVTHRAARELGLCKGVGVWLYAKTWAFRHRG